MKEYKGENETSLSIQDNLLHEVLDDALDEEICIRHTTDRECDEKDNVSLSLTGKYSSRQKKGEGEVPKKRLQGRKRKVETGKEANSSQLDPLTKHEKQKRKRIEVEKILEPDLFIRPDGLPITFLMQASRAQQRDKVVVNLNICLRPPTESRFK